MDEGEYAAIAALYPHMVRELPFILFLYEILATDKYPALKNRLKENFGQLEKVALSNPFWKRFVQ